MKTISIYDIKGGTGKTTTAKTVATGLAMDGMKICLIDLDPQGNTGKTYLYKADDLSMDRYINKRSVRKIEIFKESYLNQTDVGTICDIFNDPASITDLIRHTETPGLDIVPSNLRLSLVDTKLRLSNGRQENYLQKALRHIREDYDLVIIDCSPVKSLLTVNALYASDLVLIPITIDDDAKQGLALTLQEIESLSDIYDLDLEYRVLITMKQRTRLQDQNLKYLRYIFEDHLLETTLCYQSNPITTATQSRKTVLDLRETHIARDYKALITELEDLICQM